MIKTKKQVEIKVNDEGYLTDFLNGLEKLEKNSQKNMTFQ